MTTHLVGISLSFDCIDILSFLVFIEDESARGRRPSHHHRGRPHKKKVCRRLAESLSDINTRQQRFEQQQIEDLRRQWELQQEQLARLQQELNMLHALVPELIFTFGNLASSANSIERWLENYQHYQQQRRDGAGNRPV
jgi:DNA-binding transcriptional regulator YiaG